MSASEHSLATRAPATRQPDQSLASRAALVDPDRLCAWLAERSQTQNVVLFAVWQGLIARVRRGDFDVEEVTS